MQRKVYAFIDSDKHFSGIHYTRKKDAVIQAKHLEDMVRKETGRENFRVFVFESLDDFLIPEIKEEMPNRAYLAE